MLYKLEKSIGEQNMNAFVRKMYKQKVSSTRKLIDVLKQFADYESIKIRLRYPMAFSMV